MNTDYLNTEEASQYLRLASSTLTKKRLYGDGPIYSKVGRRVIYRRADLDNWVESHSRSNTSENRETDL